LASGDSVFVGSAYGLSVFYPFADSARYSDQIYLPNQEIFALAGTDDALWIGTDQGVFRLKYKTGKMERLNIMQVTASGYINDITVGPEKIWVASEDNLVAIDPETAEVTEFPEVNSYGGVRAVDSQGDIVAAAVGDGLLLIFMGKKKTQKYLYTQNDGLPSNNIRDVLFDGEYLWIGSDMGLTRFWHRHPGLYY
jgi:ligand-binding sensor domain-containing protein